MFEYVCGLVWLVGSYLRPGSVYIHLNFVYNYVEQK